MQRIKRALSFKGKEDETLSELAEQMSFDVSNGKNNGKLHSTRAYVQHVNEILCCDSFPDGRIVYSRL